MALIVEDGTGLSNAESFMSVAEATAYHLANGNKAAWSEVAGELTKEAMLRQATTYIQNRYFAKWCGHPVLTTQKLDWPRTGVLFRNGGFVASTSVPSEVKAACAELALRAASAALMPDGAPTVTFEKIGPIEVKYEPFTTPADPYAAIDALLAPFLVPGSQSGINAGLVRG
jgi:hypothetical protein